MARAPNYSFERQERKRQKALKVAQKAAARKEARDSAAGSGRPSEDGR
jgi:hypothetical protein